MSLRGRRKVFFEDGAAAEADGRLRRPQLIGTLGSEVHLRMEFPSGLCDNQPSSMAQGLFTSPIPPFRPDGYLPEGVHVCSEAEVIFRFGSSSRRRRGLALRLRHGEGRAARC